MIYDIIMPTTSVVARQNVETKEKTCIRKYGQTLTLCSICLIATIGIGFMAAGLIIGNQRGSTDPTSVTYLTIFAVIFGSLASAAICSMCICVCRSAYLKHKQEKKDFELQHAHAQIAVVVQQSI